MKRFIFAFLLSIVTGVSYSVPAYATVDTIIVNGEGTNTGGSYVAGSGDWNNINTNESPPTTYLSYLIGNATTTIAHDWAFASMAGTPDTINSVTVTSVIKLVSASNLKLYYYSGGTYYESSALSATGGWDTFTYVVNPTNPDINPATAAAWTSADIAAAQFGVKCLTDGYMASTGFQVAYMKVDVDYTAVAVPTVTTQAVSVIAPTTATGNGNVTSDGGSVITERGTVYNTTANPDTATGTKDTSAGTTGAFTTSIDTLTKGTLYHVRAYAINAIGTSYGADVSFTTINDPTITTSTASLVSSTTARLNSAVTFDGSVVTGEPCTIRFVYIAGTGYADYAAIVAGAETTVDVAGTWIQGQSPYADITGLAVSTTYSYAVRIVNSTATYAYGAVTTFTTESGVYTPTNFTAIPTATSVSLAWAKGVGAQYTLVRYSDATYPLTTADGIVAYLDTGNSKTLTGLTPGTTYYFAAWGKTAAVYSASSITTIATTLAYDTAVSTGTIEAPPSNSWWNQTPSTAKVSAIPLVSALISTNAAVYAIPEASLWYFLWVLFSVGLGVIIYVKSGMNLVAGLGSQALLFALGAVLGLTMLWIMVIFMVIGAGFSLWGNRH
jgi:hypothetical protein